MKKGREMQSLTGDRPIQETLSIRLTISLRFITTSQPTAISLLQHPPQFTLLHFLCPSENRKQQQHTPVSLGLVHQRPHLPGPERSPSL